MLSSGSRVLKFAFQDFFRNFWLSFVTLTILVLALFSINLLIIFNLVAQASIGAIEDKVNVSVYFKPEITQDQVLAVSKNLQGLNEVKDVTYISSEQALENFKTRHQDNPEILQSIDELGKNPLGASLIVTAKVTDQYTKIMQYLAEPHYDNLIESKNFDDHRLVISRISNLMSKVNTGVVAVALVFVIIALLIIFNAIRMAIYTHKEEIMAMKLLGATNWFVQAPFLLEGIIFAILSVLLTIIIVYPLVGVIQPYVSSLLETNFNLVTYFTNNFFTIFGLELLGAILINLISSYWAVSKYVRV
ncbi:MAG: permease-like cell division protein FtsX [Patescibacteria group bacterium]|nr:permease-like cell division protein FtsX [Patescibacteria group bacterium]